MLKKFASSAFVVSALCLPLAGCEVETDDTDTLPVAPGVEAPANDMPEGDVDAAADMDTPADDGATMGEMNE